MEWPGNNQLGIVLLLFKAGFLTSNLKHKLDETLKDFELSVF